MAKRHIDQGFAGLTEAHRLDGFTGDLGNGCRFDNSDLEGLRDLGRRLDTLLVRPHRVPWLPDSVPPMLPGNRNLCQGKRILDGTGTEDPPALAKKTDPNAIARRGDQLP